MKQLLCLCMVILLLLAATACSSGTDADTSNGGAEGSTPAQAKALKTYQDSTRLEWLQNGYWCKVADDEKSMQIYTFSEDDAGDGMYQGLCTPYQIKDGKILKDDAKDPITFSYQVDGDEISAVDSDGKDLAFSLSDDGTILTQSGDDYIRTGTLTDNYSGLKAMLS